MNVLSLSGVATVSVALLCSPASASVVTVINLGSILNDSISLPNTSDTKTAGKGEIFSDYYEFSLPKAEFVSASMSISGPTVDQIPSGQGHLILSTWTSAGSSAPFVPAGTTIQEATVSAPAAGGQDAVVGTFSSWGDSEPAGSYFVEITGMSGGGSLRLAIDGNVTAIPDPVTVTSAPEPSTWAMMFLGFAGIAWAAWRRAREPRSAT
jgi:hypothetical protein